MKTLLLYLATALAEILGCYLGTSQKTENKAR